MKASLPSTPQRSILLFRLFMLLIKQNLNPSSFNAVLCQFLPCFTGSGWFCVFHRQMLFRVGKIVLKRQRKVQSRFSETESEIICSVRLHALRFTTGRRWRHFSGDLYWLLYIYSHINVSNTKKVKYSCCFR